MSAPSGLLSHLAPPLLATAKELASKIDQKKGELLLVGGTVRDLILQKSPHELDVEVRGLSLEQVKSSLSPTFSFDEVGKNFGVLRLKGLPVEIALPRTEIKSGTGHKGFSIEIDPFLPFEKAVQRRDFTINAMGLDPLTGKLLDPTGGEEDMGKRILRNVGPAFQEDSLRVLRGMQFIARFELTPTEETIEICRSMNISDLPPERIFEEWRKLILKSKKPSAGLNFLKDTGWLRFFPELSALDGCLQEPEWHPEGDVWVHTLHCMDAFARERIGEDWEDLVVGFAVLCHDLGKPLTTHIAEDGRIRSPMHEPRGEEPTRSFLSRMTNQVDLIEQVVPLVKRHLTPRIFYKDQAGEGAIRRLAQKLNGSTDLFGLPQQILQAAHQERMLSLKVLGFWLGPKN